MEVTIMITNIKCKITSKLSYDQLSLLRDLCSFKVEGSDYKINAYRRKNIKWDGRRKLFNMETREFPIGLLSRVIEFLGSYGIDVNLENNRLQNRTEIFYNIENYQSRDYQTNAVLSSVTYGNGIIKAATGSGKTTIAARTIAALNKKAIFVIHTRDLLYQTIESFSRMFPDEIIGQIGDGKYEPNTITVATMQTLAKLGNIDYEKYKYDEDSDGYVETWEPEDAIKMEFKKYSDTVGTVMFDEVQRICSITAYTARFLFKYANYAFGYSASPWRDDGSDLMIEAAFGQRIVDITATSLIRQGYLVRPIIDIYPIDSGACATGTYQQVYESAIVNNTLRNIRIVNDACEQYKLGRNTLVLVTQIKHGEILENMLCQAGAPAVFISGKSRMKKRTSVIQDMRDGKAPIVIASTIADVGLDVPRLQSIVEAGAGKSSVTALQRLGRIMRPFEGKDLCYFITYRDSAMYLNSQMDKKIQIWQTEEDFIINEH